MTRLVTSTEHFVLRQCFAHATIDAAAPFVADIDAHGCGHTCTGRHELVRFDWTAP